MAASAVVREILTFIDDRAPAVFHRSQPFSPDAT